MSLTVFRFVCERGHEFEAPDASGTYGEFVMRGEKSTEPGLFQAVENSAYAEVEALLYELGAFRGLAETQQLDLLQDLFGVACDPAPDGTRFRIGRKAPCPVCGTREMSSWEPVGPYCGSFHRVTQSEWSLLSKQEKMALLAGSLDGSNEI